ncbi:MAG: hypothetical protein QOF92_860 [Pseudonocardiales bacterium]|jgi:uncharacterized membrane protein YphA (DoxX/SURF4 family)|nr:hypothetical protein [Pseudonocardiales bacterium]MDT4927993.1 hypothetical protein [Pseudonocardiales bacterium]
MSLSAKVRRAPLRVVTGAFIISSGVSKLRADEDTAKQLHGLAGNTYGFLGKLDPKLFAKALGAGETALGTVVLLPVVSPVVAGAGLMGFSGALLNLYWNTPGMHEEGSPKPTQQGIAIAKDTWMFGIGAALVADGILSPAHDKHVELASTVHEKRNRKAKQSRKARKAAKLARAQAKGHALEVARETGSELTKRAKKSAALKRAHQASDKAAKRLGEARDEYGPVAVEKAKSARDAARQAARQAAAEYGPVVAQKTKQARRAAKDARDEYGPIAAERARAARDAAIHAAEEYGPVAADKARQARDAAVDAARSAADEYGPIVVERAKQARDAAQQAADRAQQAVR